MTDAWWDDDDALLAAVKSALQREREVPASFRQAGEMAYAWHNIDAELAALSYDSADDPHAAMLTRAETAALRSLTFDARELSIEIEIVSETLRGQIVPPQPGEVEVHQASGKVTRAAVDEVGYFTSAPLPAGTFRLLLRTSDQRSILTDWITL